MANVFEEYAQEREQENALNCLKEGASIEFVAKVFSNLTLETILELKEQLEIKPAI